MYIHGQWTYIVPKTIQLEQYITIPTHLNTYILPCKRSLIYTKSTYYMSANYDGFTLSSPRFTVLTKYKHNAVYILNYTQRYAYLQGVTHRKST